MPASRLTICSVSFRSGHFLDLNWKLTAALNPQPLPAWLVVDNTPPGPRAPGGSPPSPFTILPGVPPPSGMPEKVLGSYHHAAALQTALAHVATRYLLILDPDFYIVQPGWVQRIVGHMETHGLAFFGVPWHPRWFVKYRGFPCVHCMFIDTEQVKIDALDFSPDGLAPGRFRTAWKTLERKTPRVLWSSYLGMHRLFLTLTQAGRLQIGQTADTGTRVFRRFGADGKVRAEIATPVFDETREALAPAQARTGFARRLERLLPARFRYFPEPGACTARGFAGRGLQDARALGCEEFVWRDEPFGFHYRQTAQAATPEASRKDAVENLIAAFLSRTPLPRDITPSFTYTTHNQPMQNPRLLTIGSLTISDDSDCYVIAEVGNNHQGEMAKAIALFRAAKDSGCHAVKLQKRDNRSLYTRKAFDMPYENPNSFGATYGEHREFLEFGKKEYVELQQLAKELGIDFFATAFDFPSTDFLAEFDMPLYKIASGDLKNIPLIKKVAQLGKPVIVSVGGGSIDDAQRVYDEIMPINPQLIFLQCTATYPTDPQDMNLRVITTLRERFPEVVAGLSDHSNGIVMAVAAYMLGGRVVEKHFTLNHTWKGTDHALSLEPIGMHKMVRDLQRTRVALGSPVKQLLPNEAGAIKKMGKSLFAARDLPAGHVLTAADIAMKCPGGGIPPAQIGQLLGRKTTRAFTEDELFETAALS